MFTQFFVVVVAVDMANNTHYTQYVRTHANEKFRFDGQHTKMNEEYTFTTFGINLLKFTSTS